MNRHSFDAIIAILVLVMICTQTNIFGFYTRVFKTLPVETRQVKEEKASDPVTYISHSAMHFVEWMLSFGSDLGRPSKIEEEFDAQRKKAREAAALPYDPITGEPRMTTAPLSPHPKSAEPPKVLPPSLVKEEARSGKQFPTPVPQAQMTLGASAQTGLQPPPIESPKPYATPTPTPTPKRPIRIVSVDANRNEIKPTTPEE